MAENSASGEDVRKKLDLTASYRSPVNASFDLIKPLTAPADDSVESRTRYLKELRASVVSAQEEINKELTARMEEDKARDTDGSKSAVDEAKEEENYGEDMQDEE